MFELHNKDCLQYMKTLPDKRFDMIVTDPPYGLGIAANPVRQKHERENWDSEIPNDEIFAEMFRVSKHQIIWGGNYYPLPPHKNYLIWDKQQPENFTLAMCEMAWTSFDMPAKIFRYSVQREGANIHPTQKPVALMRWCIAKFAEAGWSIFDPFAGVASTLVAAVELGLPAYGCEISTRYHSAGLKRVKQAVSMPSFYTLPNNRLHMDAGDSPRLPSQSTLEGFTPAEQGTTPAPRQ